MLRKNHAPLTSDRPLQVGENQSTFGDSVDNGGEVIVQKQHVTGEREGNLVRRIRSRFTVHFDSRSFFTNVGSRDVHGDTETEGSNVSQTQEDKQDFTHSARLRAGASLTPSPV